MLPSKEYRMNPADWTLLTALTGGHIPANTENRPTRQSSRRNLTQMNPEGGFKTSLSA